MLLQPRHGRWMHPFETWKLEGYYGPPDQKAGALFSSNDGQTWDEWSIVADYPTGQLCYWDQMYTQLADRRIYTMLWVHRYSTSEDTPNHYVISVDKGQTWGLPIATNLKGQVCCPIPLADGRVATIYDHRREPQGIRVALSEDLKHFVDVLTVFGVGSKATLGQSQSDNFLAEHLLITFIKPGCIQLPAGDILIWYWCTVNSVTHTRWARLQLQ